MDVYSGEYNLCGKIDLFDVERGLLTERKNHIEKIYDGYVFQLYAQCLCLREMGYTVKSMRFYSSTDNKTYSVRLPEWLRAIFMFSLLESRTLKAPVLVPP